VLRVYTLFFLPTRIFDLLLLSFDLLIFLGDEVFFALLGFSAFFSSLFGVNHLPSSIRFSFPEPCGFCWGFTPPRVFWSLKVGVGFSLLVVHVLDG